MKNSWYAYLFGALLVLIAGVSIYFLLWRSKAIVDDVVVEDVQHLQQIFKKINDRCGIINFDYQKNLIDFLTVKSFVSSEIGTMNLAYANNWEGPYVQDNPEIEGKYYQIIKTIKGYFITPGDGVKLANGKVIGSDIVLDYNTDIEKLMMDPTALQSYNKKPLAAKIDVRGA
jgi:hypothetical protein